MGGEPCPQPGPHGRPRRPSLPGMTTSSDSKFVEIEKAAQALGLDVAGATTLIRTDPPAGTIRTNDGRFWLTHAGLERLLRARAG